MNYYEILGVSQKATPGEIAGAKNKLAKKYHPDSNLKDGVDTTAKMQEILEAYAVLSDPQSRSDYDMQISGNTRIMQTFDLHEMKDETTGEQSYPSFLTYWKSACKLHEIIKKSQQVPRGKDGRNALRDLSAEALRQAATLRRGGVPEKYWHLEIMNWLLFTWNNNRNYSTAYLLTLYESHLKHDAKCRYRIRIERCSRSYQRQIRKLIQL